MKVTIIGGGSSYTPELINGFLERLDQLPVTELWLHDILSERLEIVGKFAQRMVAARGNPFTVHLTENRQDAIRDTNYVITQLRVGWMKARREDEYLGKRHGLIGQETTGVGGMAKALRTIPVILDIAREISLLAPNALLVNFTNPAGLITEAVSRHVPEVQAVGVCNAPFNAHMDMLKALEKEGIFATPQNTKLDTLGLNHLTWHRGFSVDGKDVWGDILKHYLAELRTSDEPEWETELIENLQMIPNYYLQYYYHTSHKLKMQENEWPPSRAEEVMEVEKMLLAKYAEPNRTEPPEELMQRGGAYYSTVATQLLNAHHNDLDEVHVVNIPHRGAVEGWQKDWVLEMPCRINAKGVHPIKTAPLPPSVFGLVSQIKVFELLTIQAAVNGDRTAAYQALLAHPLGPESDQVEAVLKDMLETNKKYLPQF